MLDAPQEFVSSTISAPDSSFLLRPPETAVPSTWMLHVNSHGQTDTPNEAIAFSRRLIEAWQKGIIVQTYCAEPAESDDEQYDIFQRSVVSRLFLLIQNKYPYHPNNEFRTLRKKRLTR